MAKRKYITEFGLVALQCHHAIVQLQDLDRPELIELFGGDYPANLYMITRRPRITIDVSSTEADSNQSNLHFNIHADGRTEKRITTLPPHLVGNRLVAEFPYSKYKMLNINDDVVLEGNASILFQILNSSTSYDSALDLEVLYIGQSVGRKEDRSPIDRLKKHETLLKIYADTAQNSPDCDIWLALFHVQTDVITSLDGATTASCTTEEDDAHVKRILGQKYDKQVWINFSEAALITYFMPEYNIKFKGTFPNPVHSSYSRCYDIEINSVLSEVQTDNSRIRLWSANAPPAFTHFAKFALYDESDRRGMFDALRSDATSS